MGQFVAIRLSKVERSVTVDTAQNVTAIAVVQVKLILTNANTALKLWVYQIRPGAGKK